MGAYDDIIHLPHHVSKLHPPMPIADRAAQFMPFRALTGYEAAVKESARLTGQRAELTEDEKAALDGKLRELARDIARRPTVTLTWFRPDSRKAGGTYITTTGQLRRVDEYERVLVLAEGSRIPIEEIRDIQRDVEELRPYDEPDGPLE